MIGHARDVGRIVRAVQDRAQRPRPRHRHERVAARGHDRCKARHAIRMARRENLRHHAAQRHADNVRLRNPERVEKSRDVVCHVREIVGRVDLEAHHRPRHRHRHRRVVGLGNALREPAVAIVEAKHAQPRLHEAVDECVRPEDERHAETHHQDHRGGAGFSALLVGEGNPVRRYGRHRFARTIPGAPDRGRAMPGRRRARRASTGLPAARAGRRSHARRAD